MLRWILRSVPVDFNERVLAQDDGQRLKPSGGSRIRGLRLHSTGLFARVLRWILRSVPVDFDEGVLAQDDGQKLKP